jgi:endonuclease III
MTGREGGSSSETSDTRDDSIEAKLLDERKARQVVEELERAYPDSHYYLNFKTPIDLVVAAILSAQTRDEVTNSVTPELFKRYKTASDYAKADPDELYGYVKRVTFGGNKVKNIIKTCKIIEERYKGVVPKRMEELVELPGIGRKTANTILINAYKIVEGIPVDTWVIKVPGRIGLTKNTDPELIEQDLMKLVEKRYWHNFAYVCKNHGKKLCQSTAPLCSQCFLNRICMKNGVTGSR